VYHHSNLSYFSVFEIHLAMSRFFKHYYCSNIVAFLPSLIMHQSFQSGKIGDRIFLTRPSSSRLLQGRIVERGTVGHLEGSHSVSCRFLLFIFEAYYYLSSSVCVVTQEYSAAERAVPQRPVTLLGNICASRCDKFSLCPMPSNLQLLVYSSSTSSSSTISSVSWLRRQIL
jgi:hypothetical protein